MSDAAAQFDRLIDIMIEEKLGVQERKALHLNEQFFDVFR